MANTDFLLERTLQELDPQLHRRFTDTVFVLTHTLGNFQRLFPEFTDHSEFHSMNVLNFCNILVGEEQVGLMNADEIFVLLMSCYLHDVGMAITENDYAEFKDELDETSYFERWPNRGVSDFVRDYHNEFSGMFIKKYADFLEIPSEEHCFAIMQVARGHRRTELFDPSEYPASQEMPNGNIVNVAFLAALIRLADEIDVVTDRNPKLLYDIQSLTDDFQISENRRLEAVERMDILQDSFVLIAHTDDRLIWQDLQRMIQKMQLTLNYCREVVRLRSPYEITQKHVVLQRV